jgi:hypothetical protein
MNGSGKRMLVKKRPWNGSTYIHADAETNSLAPYSPSSGGGRSGKHACEQPRTFSFDLYRKIEFGMGFSAASCLSTSSSKASKHRKCTLTS